MKKVLSIVLSLVMVICMMPVMAFAGTSTTGLSFTDASEIEHSEAVNMLTSLDVIDGYTDGSFKPDATVTRAEMAKMITIALNGGEEPVLNTTATSYTDTKGHWAAGYIEYCTSLDIVAGVGAGKFNPNATVTAEQAAKMVLVAMGYDSTVFKFTGAQWASNVNVAANQAGLYKELSDIKTSTGLTREHAAQMMYNGVQSKTMKITYSQDMETGEITQNYTLSGDSLLVQKFGAEEEYGYLSDVAYNKTTGKYTYTFTNGSNEKFDTITADHVSNIIATKTDYSSLMGSRVKVVYKDSSTEKYPVYGMYAENTSVIATATGGDIKITAGSEKISINKVEYKLADEVENIEVYSAGGKLTGNLDSVTNYQNYTLLDNNNDGKIDCAFTTPFTVKKVTYVGKKNVTAGASYEFETDNIYEGIAKDDYAVIVEAADTAKDEDTLTKCEIVNGKVTATKEDSSSAVTDIRVNDTWYKLATPDDCAMNNTYDLAVVNGYVIEAEQKASAVSIDNYAVLLKAEAAASGVNENPLGKLLLTDGTTKTVELDKNYRALETVMVTYKESTDKDNTYTLKKAVELDAETSGFDLKLDSHKGYAYDKDGSKIGSAYIDDNAVVFVKNGSKYEVITGAQLAKLNNATNYLAFANLNKSTGFNYVELAYVGSNNYAAGDTVYGLLTAAPTKETIDNKTVYKLAIWNGAENITVTTKESASPISGLAKGAVVSYKMTATENVISTVKVESLTESAVTAYNGNKIEFAGGTASAGKITLGTIKPGKIDEDTVIVYFNADDVEGVEDGSIQRATETETAKTYYTNCAYKFGTGDHVDVLFVEVSNNYSNVTMA